MTILNTLPDQTVKRILNQDKELREDLRAIPFAEYLGWKVSFKDDDYFNPAIFTKGNMTVRVCYKYYKNGVTRWIRSDSVCEMPYMELRNALWA